MSEQTFICYLAELTDPGSYGFSIELEQETIEGFVVQRDGQQFAYRNSCPHTGSQLDWVEHQFLDLDKAFIQCATHDARFEMETGFCVAGPCAGQSLQPLKIVNRDDAIYLDAVAGGLGNPPVIEND